MFCGEELASQTRSGAVVPFAAAVALVLDVQNQEPDSSLNCSLGTCLGNVSFGWFYLSVFDKWWFQAVVGAWYSPSIYTLCRVYSGCQENSFWCISQNLVHSVHVRGSSVIATVLSWRLCQVRRQLWLLQERWPQHLFHGVKLMVGSRQDKMPWKQWPLWKADSDLPLPRWHNKSDALDMH